MVSSQKYRTFSRMEFSIFLFAFISWTFWKVQFKMKTWAMLKIKMFYLHFFFLWYNTFLYWQPYDNPNEETEMFVVNKVSIMQRVINVRQFGTYLIYDSSWQLINVQYWNDHCLFVYFYWLVHKTLFFFFVFFSSEVFT